MRNFAALGASLAVLASCGRSAPSAPPPEPSAAALPPSAAPLPPDRTLPDELAQGESRVAGLWLPSGFRVDRVFEAQTHVRGPASPEQTANYLRRRLEAGRVDVGPNRTIFSAARPRGQGGPELRVEVNAIGGSTEIVIIELRPAPVDPNLTEEERWRRAGMKPSGGLLDPQTAF